MNHILRTTTSTPDVVLGAKMNIVDAYNEISTKVIRVDDAKNETLIATINYIKVNFDLAINNQMSKYEICDLDGDISDLYETLFDPATEQLRDNLVQSLQVGPCQNLLVIDSIIFEAIEYNPTACLQAIKSTCDSYGGFGSLIAFNSESDANWNDFFSQLGFMEHADAPGYMLFPGEYRMNLQEKLKAA